MIHPTPIHFTVLFPWAYLMTVLGFRGDSVVHVAGFGIRYWEMMDYFH